MNRAWRLGLGLGVVLTGCGPVEAHEDRPEAAMASASAYAVAPRCGPSTLVSLPQVLPDKQLTGALHVDVGHLRRGKLFPDVERLLTTEASEFTDAMKACGVPLSKVERVVAGFSDGSDVVLGVKAQGLGEASTLDCFARKLTKATGESPWRRVSTGCTTTLEMSDGDGEGFVVARDTVVFASKGLKDAVKRRVEGKDRSALDGRLGWARHEINMTGTAWVAGNIPAAARSGMGSALAGLSRVGASIDASRGLALTMGAGFSSAAEAKAAHTEIGNQVGQLKAMLPMLGLPSSVGNTIKLDAKGTLVTMEMFLSRSELDALRKSLESMVGGSSSPPPPPPKGGI